MSETRYYHAILQHVTNDNVSIGTAFLTDSEVAAYNSLCDHMHWFHTEGDSGYLYLDNNRFETEIEAEEYAKNEFKHLYDDVYDDLDRILYSVYNGKQP